MSELGQSRQFGDVRATSALPPKTDICRKRRHVSNAAEPVRFSVDSEVIDSRSVSELAVTMTIRERPAPLGVGEITLA